MSCANIHKLQQANSKLEKEGPRHICKTYIGLGLTENAGLSFGWAMSSHCALFPGTELFLPQCLLITFAPSPWPEFFKDWDWAKVTQSPRRPKDIWIFLEMLMNFLERKDSGCYGFVAYRYQNQNHHPFQFPKDWIHLTWFRKVHSETE